ncbi:hypothetical protein ACFX15_034366 [Malus domestica]
MSMPPGCRGIRESAWQGQAGQEREVTESTRCRATHVLASEGREGAAYQHTAKIEGWGAIRRSEPEVANSYPSYHSCYKMYDPSRHSSDTRHHHQTSVNRSR